MSDSLELAPGLPLGDVLVEELPLDLDYDTLVVMLPSGEQNLGSLLGGAVAESLILALSLILGGALGNIKDRYEFGYVVDFADFHIGTFRPFLIFNVADAAITIGVVILLARALFMREKPATGHTDS